MASSMNYILAPLALLFLVAFTTPTVSAQGSGFYLVVNGTLYCSPDVTQCTATTPASVCRPLVGSTLVLVPFAQVPFATTTTDTSGKFSFNVSIPAPTFNALLLSTSPTSVVVYPVSTCPALTEIPGEFAEARVTISQFADNTVFATIGN